MDLKAVKSVTISSSNFTEFEGTLSKPDGIYSYGLSAAITISNSIF